MAQHVARQNTGQQSPAADYEFNPSYTPDKTSDTAGFTPEKFDSSGLLDSSVEDINRLTSGDSQLMRGADTRAKQSANAAGLLNSSMAVGATEASRLDTVMPLVQQNAQTRGQAELSDRQNVYSDYSQTNQQNFQSDLSGQEFEQAGLLNEQSNTAASDLSAQNYEQNYGLNTQQNTFAAGENELNRQQEIEVIGVDSDSRASLIQLEQEWNNYMTTSRSLSDFWNSQIDSIGQALASGLTPEQTDSMLNTFLGPIGADGKRSGGTLAAGLSYLNGLDAISPGVSAGSVGTDRKQPKWPNGDPIDIDIPETPGATPETPGPGIEVAPDSGSTPGNDNVPVTGNNGSDVAIDTGESDGLIRIPGTEAPPMDPNVTGPKTFEDIKGGGAWSTPPGFLDNQPGTGGNNEPGLIDSPETRQTPGNDSDKSPASDMVNVSVADKEKQNLWDAYAKISEGSSLIARSADQVDIKQITNAMGTRVLGRLQEIANNDKLINLYQNYVDAGMNQYQSKLDEQIANSNAALTNINSYRNAMGLPSFNMRQASNAIPEESRGNYGYRYDDWINDISK